ncbi:hypothetical protein ACFL42_00395 [Candidatus Omnitrophota bacterium]
MAGRDSETNENLIKKESGGKTKIILVTRVHKEATDERMSKLVDEINLLETLPEEWKIHFPKIALSHISADKVFYEMPLYNLPTLRRLLFSGVLKHKDVLRWIKRIVEFSFKMYKKEILPMPDNYMDYMHFTRLRRRLEELSKKTEVFKKLIPQKTLIINRTEYKNIPMVMEILKRSENVNKVLPEFVSKWGHSDLHFSNVMIDLENDNFVFIDPRGYPFCDYYYDYGKLWHSVNGKYEFIAENMFELDGTNFELKKNDVYWECEKIKDKLPEILCAYSSEPRGTVMMKTEFNEAMHFCSLVPFILDFDGREKRALAGYYTGTILLNKFLEKYCGGPL